MKKSGEVGKEKREGEKQFRLWEGEKGEEGRRREKKGEKGRKREKKGVRKRAVWKKEGNKKPGKEEREGGGRKAKTSFVKGAWD